MRAKWESVRTALVSTTSTLEAEREFRKSREREAALRRFESPSALVAYLTSRVGDPEEKDRIYGALVRAVQAHADWSELASAILWLGLWPGLDHVYRRRLHLFLPRADELVSAIGELFTAGIDRADLSSIKRLAATLVKNVKRDLVDERRREWRHAAAEEASSDDRLEWAASEVQEVSSRVDPPATSDEFAIARLRGRLRPALGDDTDLLLTVLIMGETQREAADRLGIRHATARKRFQRALGLARKLFQNDLSHSDSKICVSPVKGTRESKGRPRR
jgi:DNA-directed RNA polymerase specialized sigma24 family protein